MAPEWPDTPNSAASPQAVVVDPTRLFAHRLVLAIRGPAPWTRVLIGLNIAVAVFVFLLPYLQGIEAGQIEVSRQLEFEVRVAASR